MAYKVILEQHQQNFTK